MTDCKGTSHIFGVGVYQLEQKPWTDLSTAESSPTPLKLMIDLPALTQSGHGGGIATLRGWSGEVVKWMESLPLSGTCINELHNVSEILQSERSNYRTKASNDVWRQCHSRLNPVFDGMLQVMPFTTHITNRHVCVCEEVKPHDDNTGIIPGCAI